MAEEREARAREAAAHRLGRDVSAVGIAGEEEGKTRSMPGSELPLYQDTEASLQEAFLQRYEDMGQVHAHSAEWMDLNDERAALEEALADVRDFKARTLDPARDVEARRPSTVEHQLAQMTTIAEKIHALAQELTRDVSQAQTLHQERQVKGPSFGR